MIGVGVHLYICMYMYVTPKKFEWPLLGALNQVRVSQRSIYYTVVPSLKLLYIAISCN